MQPPDLPAGAQLLSVDEVVDALVTGDHADTATGTVALDAALIDALRAGLLVACRLSDGRIAFAPTSNKQAE
ncbi:hypothetical protein AB0K00_21490 [Dactylosporangium sp. NPDC049525]|uniref:hypothetical protein n=1 Tax=Dactylosporangium sp. NPDC049525 TaxID=3154730 RepID=UPI003449DE19